MKNSYSKFFAVIYFKKNKTKKIENLDSSSTATEFLYDYPSCVKVDLFRVDADTMGETTNVCDFAINHLVVR